MLKAFEKGIKRHLEFKGSTSYTLSPSTGKKWLIIGGLVIHSGITEIYIEIMLPDTTTVYEKLYHKLETAAAGNPLFNTESQKVQAQFAFYTVEDYEQLFVVADAADVVMITVLEWE